MLSVWLIRHAESEANAGRKTVDPVSTPLTEKGWEQAHILAQSLEIEPSLIITSPYARAKQTAAPIQARFPHIPVESWPIQEFTYLRPSGYANTTQKERRPFVDAFWKKADPSYCDGEGAESFLQFLDRVKQMKERLQNYDAQNPTQTLAYPEINKRPILLFGHGQFIRAFLFLLLTQKTEIDSESMKQMGSFIQAFYLPNTSILRCWFFPEEEIRFSTVITAHLPKELQT